jgi:hypothetical protein
MADLSQEPSLQVIIPLLSAAHGLRQLLLCEQAILITFIVHVFINRST